MKQLLKRVFYNKTFPVLKGNLKGLKLRINDLQKGSIFIQDHEPEKQESFLQILQPNDVFFDVGGNVGIHSYFVARNFPKVKIFTFEPLVGNANYIKETCQKNNITSIELIESAVGNMVGTISFKTSFNNSVGQISNSTTGLQVRITTLDTFVAAKGIDPDVIKIDIEGAEGDALKGAEKLIDRKKPVFIIELHSPDQDLLVAKLLLDKGYSIYRLNQKGHLDKDRLLLTIKDFTKSWPEPEGVWGDIIAIHSSRKNDYPKLKYPN